MISHGIEISITGGVGEMAQLPGIFFNFYFYI